MRTWFLYCFIKKWFHTILYHFKYLIFLCLMLTSQMKFYFCQVPLCSFSIDVFFTLITSLICFWPWLNTWVKITNGMKFKVKPRLFKKEMYIQRDTLQLCHLLADCRLRMNMGAKTVWDDCWVPIAAVWNCYDTIKHESANGVTLGQPTIRIYNNMSNT